MQNRQIFRSLQKVVALCFTVVMLYQPPLHSQTSEVELIGTRKHPFSVVIGDKALPVREKNRLNLSGLSPGVMVLQINFKDTLVEPLRDTLILEAGLCYVYRIVRDREISGILSSGGELRRVIGRDGGTERPSFRLKLLEVVEVKDAHGSRSTGDVDTMDRGILVHNTGYHFTRQEPVVVSETRAVSAPASSGAVTGDSQSAPPDVSAQAEPAKFTDAQFSQLERRLRALRFEEERMKLLDQSMKQRMVTSQQLLTLLGYFDFERSKVRIFKQYYHQLLDPEGHANLYQAFDFGSTIDELKHWVNEQR